MSELRSALLHITKGDEERYMIFEDHNDAFESAYRYKSQGWGWVISAFDTFKSGELPDDLPPKQIEMKLDGDA